MFSDEPTDLKAKSLNEKENTFTVDESRCSTEYTKDKAGNQLVQLL